MAPLLPPSLLLLILLLLMMMPKTMGQHDEETARRIPLDGACWGSSRTQTTAPCEDGA